MRILTYITTEEDAGRAARSVVPRRFQLGTHAFRRLKVEGGILCDGKPLRADTVLRAGQLLEVRMDNGGVQAAPARQPVWTACRLPSSATSTRI